MPAIDRNVPHVNQTLPDAINAIRQSLTTLEDTETNENAVIQSRLSALEQYSTPPIASSTALFNFMHTRKMIFDAVRTAKVTSSAGTIPLTKAISTTSGSAVVSSISFRGEVMAGDTLTINGSSFTVASVDSDTQVTLTTAPTFTGTYGTCTANNAHLKAVDIEFTDPRVSWATVQKLIVTSGDSTQGYSSLVNGNIYWMKIFIDLNQSYDKLTGPTISNCFAAISTSNNTMPNISGTTTYDGSIPVHVSLRAVGAIVSTTVSITEVGLASDGAVELIYPTLPSVSDTTTSLSSVSVANYIPPSAKKMTGTHRIVASGMTTTGDQSVIVYYYITGASGNESSVAAEQLRCKPSDAGFLQKHTRIELPITQQNMKSQIIISSGSVTGHNIYPTGYIE